MTEPRARPTGACLNHPNRPGVWAHAPAGTFRCDSCHHGEEHERQLFAGTPELISLGEQPHDPRYCDRGGEPHLGPCVDPGPPGFYDESDEDEDETPLAGRASAHHASGTDFCNIAGCEIC